ncbi:hypothetical protein PHMEG_0003706 [Phytophthora megakarya]|uniref:Uncharacterized protein n=1 Tax=Phytophthora megakarya TaxID=4795 RepID=A0A225WVU0_9STRA|nr:hypothetical protein PHMEG_0003706 [Phytophthora megakarya]
MSRRTPRQPLLSAGNGIHDRPKTIKPRKLPTMNRGGGLRLGRIVSDARQSSPLDNQSPSVFVQEEERRVQEELIEMLTVKLANKEKEVEILRCKQNAVDDEFASRERQRRQLQEEHAQMASELTSMNQELQKQVQLLQIQCEQNGLFKTNKLKATWYIISKREVLTSKLNSDDLKKRINSSERQMQANALAIEEQKRKDAEKVSNKLKEDKHALKEKQRVLIKTLKDASSRVADEEKTRNKLSRVEEKLTMQLEILKKENLELKARRSQMSSQTKHLQARIGTLESANADQKQKLEDAAIELESARKYCRASQFRSKQLQEEIVFLTNRNVPSDPPVDPHTGATPELIAPQVEEAGGMPCWMKG